MALKGVLASLALGAALISGPASAQTRTYTPSEMRILAADAVKKGAPDVALTLTGALLARDPNDVEALLLSSRAQRDIGRYNAAQKSARKAWTLAEEKPRKFAAALALAQAHSSAGRKTVAKVWLRRAVQNAPDELAKRQAIRDFKYLRSVSPLLLYVQFSIAPNNNINNGSSNATSDLFGLPDVVLNGAAKALSGMEFALGVSGRYRFSQTSTRATDLLFSAYSREYVLSSEAKAIAPTAKGSDFALSTLSLGLSHSRLDPESRKETIGSLRLENTWYGRESYAYAVHGSLTRNIPLSPRKHLQLRGIARHAAAASGSSAPKQNLLKGELRYGLRLQNANHLALSLGLTDSNSPSESADYNQASLGLDYTLAKPILGAKASFGLGFRYRHYDSSPYLPTGARIDKEASASLTLDFEKLEAYGFNPTLTFSASRAQSNVGLFETRNLGLALGLRSSF